MTTAYRVLLLAGLAVAAPAALAQAPPEPKKADEKPVVVPFELLTSRHMAVQVKVNGKGPYRLIFDTGAPTNLINNRLAQDAGVTKKGAATGLLGMGGLKTLDSLELGGVRLEKVPVAVMDHPTVSAISKALGPIDGIVGFPFFARYKTTVDYQKKELTFTPNGYVPDDVMQALMQKLMAGGAKGKPEPRVAAPAGVWGFVVEKAAADEDAGVGVTEVLVGSPAFAAGLKVGDRLLTLDGRWTDSVADTFTAASLAKPGRPAEVVVSRGGKEVKLTVTPAKGV